MIHLNIICLPVKDSMIHMIVEIRASRGKKEKQVRRHQSTSESAFADSAVAKVSRAHPR